MATIRLNTVGQKCPIPVLKIAAKVAELQEGDILEVLGDCPTFEDDVRNWAERSHTTLLAVKREASAIMLQLQV